VSYIPTHDELVYQYYLAGFNEEESEELARDYEQNVLSYQCGGSGQ
jgi:hypothetical protein